MFVCESALSPGEGRPDGYMGYTHRFVNMKALVRNQSRDGQNV